MPTPSQNRLNFSHFPLQFITNGHDGDECVEQVRRVLDGGCLWVQLRMKEAGEAEVEAVAAKVKALPDGETKTALARLVDYNTGREV